jgi:hypothetical protein
MVRFGRSKGEVPNDRDCWLLCTGVERPRRRAAECSDEFPPSKANAHLHLPWPRRLGTSAHARLPHTGSRLLGEGLSPTRYLIIMGQPMRMLRSCDRSETVRC